MVILEFENIAAAQYDFNFNRQFPGYGGCYTAFELSTAVPVNRTVAHIKNLEMT
jgi:hypothetical protein